MPKSCQVPINVRSELQLRLLCCRRNLSRGGGVLLVLLVDAIFPTRVAADVTYNRGLACCTGHARLSSGAAPHFSAAVREGALMNKLVTPHDIAAGLLRAGGRAILALVLLMIAFVVATAVQEIWRA
jgi:hypothetical protein